MWLLQESITHPTTGFAVIVNKKPTFNCSINDAGTTIFLRCWAEKKSANIVLTVFEQNFAFENFGLHFWEKIDWQQIIIIKLIGKDVGRKIKQQMLCPLSSSKSLLLRAPGFISEKIIDWHQTIMTKLIWKDVEWRTKTANTVPTVFEQKFAFESFKIHFWENTWLTSNNGNQMIGKDVEWKAKRANIVPTVFEQKFAFETFTDWTSNINVQFDWKRCWVTNKTSKYILKS